MRNLVAFLFVSLFILFGCQSSAEYFEEAICIENISTIDPIDGLKENQTIIIKEGKIKVIVSSSELKLSSKNHIIDGTGKYIMPGLWDAHVHFAYKENLAPSMFDLFLAYGITSVRDTGGEIEFVKKWKDKSLANPTDAPRVMIAGPLLDGIPNVYDGSEPSRPSLSVGLGSLDAINKQINELDRQGVDLLKAYEMLSPEQFAYIIKLAKEKDLKVTGHVPLSMDVITASNNGLNSMEHLRNLELSCASNADELLNKRQQLLRAGKSDPGGMLRSRIHQEQREIAIKNYDEDKANEVLRVLLENDTWQIPTLALNTGITERHFEQKDWQETFQYLPSSLEQEWKKGARSLEEVEPTAFQKQYNSWMFNMVGKIHESKISIMAGTDCPIFLLTPGRSLHQELALLVKAGLSPLEAIKAATYNPAKYFNIENELGLIKEKMWADLLILEANPLEDINNSLLINMVIKQGKIYDRTTLDNMLERLRDNK